MSLLRISRDRDGALEVDGPLVAGGRQPVGAILERSGQGEEGAVRASSTTGTENDPATRTRRSSKEPGRSAWSRPIARPDTSRPARDASPKVNARTSGVYLRADPADLAILDGRDDRRRAELIAERLTDWKSITA